MINKNRVNELMRLINSQNEILRIMCVNNKENISDAKEDLRILNNRVNSITNTTSALKIDKEPSPRNSLPVDSLMQRWKLLDLNKKIH